MTRKKLIISVVTVCCLLSLLVYSQEPHRSGVHKPESHLELIEAETAVKMHELELKISELEVHRAEGEVGKLRMAIDAAREREDSRELAYARVDHRQAEIHVEIQKAQSEMVQLRIKLAKARLEHIKEHLRAVLDNMPSANTGMDRTR